MPEQVGQRLHRGHGDGAVAVIDGAAGDVLKLVYGS